MVDRNYAHSKRWDRVLAKWIHLTDPEFVVLKQIFDRVLFGVWMHSMSGYSTIKVLGA